MKKMISILLSFFIMFTVIPKNVFAAEEELFYENITSVNKEMLSFSTDKDETYFFETLEGMEIFIDSLPRETKYRASRCAEWDFTGGCIVDPNVYFKSTRISGITKSKMWAGYHPGTPSWTYAIGYNISSSKSYSMGGSFAYEGRTLSFSSTLSKGVTTNVSANNKRLSRLGFYNDVYVEKFRQDTYRKDSNKLLSSVYYYKTRATNSYILVVYK